MALSCLKSYPVPPHQVSLTKELDKSPIPAIIAKKHDQQTYLTRAIEEK